ncbi:hypothetical protein BS78_05G093500 [Paspalum vaginatum]|nr:hypothetical protein BS78_05G093500 [Paspalum vaginatum]
MAFSAPSRSCRARPLRSIFPATLLFNICAPGGLCTRFAALPAGGSVAAEFGRGDGFLNSGRGTAESQLRGAGGTAGDEDASAMELMGSKVPRMRRTGALGGHSIGNNNDAVLSAHLALLEDYMLTNLEPCTAPTRVADTPADNPAVNKRMGFLGSIYTIGQNMFVFCGTLAFWSLAYPLSANAKQSYDNPFMQFIIVENVLLLFLSFILAYLASHLKESGSIKGVRLHIFKWLFLTVSVALCEGFCLMLHFCANISIRVLWPLGTIVSVIILLGWICIFYIEQPKIQILEEIKRCHARENRVLLGFETPLATGLNGETRPRCPTQIQPRAELYTGPNHIPIPVEVEPLKVQ